eukprot:225965-Prymnesium_polylepis.1
MRRWAVPVGMRDASAWVGSGVLEWGTAWRSAIVHPHFSTPRKKDVKGNMPDATYGFSTAIAASTFLTPPQLEV